MKRLLGAVATLTIALTMAAFADPGPNTWEPVKKILDHKCIACHSCYTSPCQIDLSSWEGISRGATQKNVYNGTRIVTEKPTRLYIDAKTPEEWHKKFDFFSITSQGKNQEALLLDAIDLGMARTPKHQKYEFNVKDAQSCPTPGREWYEFQKIFPYKGMPFGLPAITAEERAAFTAWQEAGFPGPTPKTELQMIQEMPRGARNQVAAWEEFLNGKSLKEKIVSRYLYEHWFLAHLYFPEEKGFYFRLVRSTTPPQQEVDEIATVRPYDDPKTEKFYYRLRPVRQTIMYKNHITLPLDDRFKDRLTQLFFKTKWLAEPKSLPDYETERASNPFVVFQDMPPASRYQFLLDHTQYFSMTFIRGPVCEGQVAVNVIQDAFTVLYLDPKKDLSVTDPDFLKAAAKHLELPAKGESDPFESFYYIYKRQQREYLKYRAEAYKKANQNRMGLDSIWRGDGTNTNAVQTIFRHFDNATVILGAWGGTPKTVWVMDYPIFERMYYLLVTGFNVFGNIFHQMSTRLYMDNLRVESEDNFLYLMPPEMREEVRDYWYQGDGARAKMRLENPLYNDVYTTALHSRDFKASKTAQDRVEKLAKLILGQKEFADIVNHQDDLNCCLFKKPGHLDDMTQQLRSLTLVTGGFSSHMPELTLLLITAKDKERRLYSISRVTDLQNVSFMLNEKNRRNPKGDHLAILEQWLGSYPNLLIHLTTEQVPSFVKALTAATNADQTKAVLQKFGLDRFDLNFWQTLQLFHETLQEKWPVEYGQLDLSKYEAKLND